MTISLDIPDSAAPVIANRRYLQEALVAILYQIGHLSSKEACDMLNISRRELEDLLPRFGVSMMSEDEESNDIDLREKGIGREEAKTLRARLLPFAEDWEDPEMAIYDHYDAAHS